MNVIPLLQAEMETLKREMQELVVGARDAVHWRSKHDELAASSGAEIDKLRNLLAKAHTEARTVADKAKADEEAWRVKHDKQAGELSSLRDQVARLRAEVDAWRVKHDTLATSSSAVIERLQGELDHAHQESHRLVVDHAAKAEAWRKKQDSLIADKNVVGTGTIPATSRRA